MPVATPTIHVIIKPLAPGLWEVSAAFYFNQADEDHKIRSGCWIELVNVAFGGAKTIIVGSTDIPYRGDITFTALAGSDSDTVAFMKVYWLYVHYQNGHPGAALGPEYRVIHDFSLGLNAWSDGVDTSTEVISSKIASIYSKLHPKAQEWAKTKGLILTIKA